MAQCGYSLFAITSGNATEMFVILSMQDIADRATVTRLTVSKVEHGDPTVSMGIYARVLFALNLEKDITLLAADDALGRQIQDAELLK